MAYQLTALAAGVIFGLGLAIAQMVNPEKILGFLDVAGRWDPTLLVVMVGALAVATPAFRLILQTPAPRFASVFEVSTHRTVDARLVGGAVVFGVGWGLVGLCPGPAVGALAFGRLEPVIFLAAMVAGMFIYRTFLDVTGLRASA